MLFTDFLEALGRVADLKSWPTPSEIAAFNESKDGDAYGVVEYFREVTVGGRRLEAYPDRPSQELTAPKTQPLSYKLECMLALAHEKAYALRLI